MIHSARGAEINILIISCVAVRIILSALLNLRSLHPRKALTVGSMDIRKIHAVLS